jgi:atypical dual specificity phosphatase
MHQIDARGKCVIVHCSGGKGRTGTILAAYLLKRARQKDVLGIEERMDANQAIESLRNMRGESIQSQNQKDILYQYEAYLRNKNENQDVINR